MKYLDDNIDVIINTIRQMNGNSSDIADRKLKIGKTNIACIFLESVSSEDKWLFNEIANRYSKEKKNN